MAKKTKVAAKKARGNTYILTASGSKALETVTGQGKVIRDIIKRKGPVTAAGIVSAAGKSLDTKTPEKNVAFYLCIWKADGLVKFGPKA